MNQTQMLVMITLISFNPQMVKAMKSNQDISIILSNHEKPFVSRELALAISKAVLKYNYPLRLFSPKKKFDIVENPESWIVRFYNKNESDEFYFSNIDKSLSFQIRKSDGAVLSVSI